MATEDVVTAPHDHIVSFYDEDHHLVEDVGEFVADGLATDDAVVASVGRHPLHSTQGGTMRSSGLMTTIRTPAPNDHACHGYSSRAERDAAAVEWLAEGARINQRLIAVTGDDDAGARLLEAAAAHRGRHDVVHFSSDQIYDLSQPTDPDAQLAQYAALVARAVDDGFNGVRVFCDISPLIANPARRRSHARWEHVADSWIARGNPLAPLCAYDEAMVAGRNPELLALHPLRDAADAASTQFGLYCGPDGPVLDGQIDTVNVAALTEALATLPDGPVELDASGLSFLCARGAMTLHRAGGGDDGRPRLRLMRAQPIVRRVWDVLGLTPEMLGDEPAVSPATGQR